MSTESNNPMNNLNNNEDENSNSNNNNNNNNNSNGNKTQRKTRGPYMRISVKKREHLIRQFLASGASIRQIAAKNRLAESSVRSILKAYNEENRIAPKPRGGGRTEILITDEVSKFIQETLTENPSTTLEQLKIAISQNFDGLVVSHAKIQKHCFEHIVFTLKCMKPPTEIRHDAYAIEARKRFAAELSEKVYMYHFNCIFIDEASFRASQICKAGASLKDKSQVKVVDKSRSFDISIMAAISFFGVELIDVKISKGGTTTDIFIEFLKDVLKKIENHDIGRCILLESSLLQNSPEVRGWIDSYNNSNMNSPIKHEIKFIPPFSPFLHPVKQFFTNIDRLVKRSKLTMKNDMIDCITKAKESITRGDCENWVNQSASLL